MSKGREGSCPTIPYVAEEASKPSEERYHFSKEHVMMATGLGGVHKTSLNNLLPWPK